MNQEQCTSKTRKNQHLNKQEREIIQRQLEMRTAKSKIATMLNRDLSTIKREVKRGTVKQKKLIEISTAPQQKRINEILNPRRKSPPLGGLLYTGF